jgi:acyl-CoA synthetase (AMP-forming)/AMP-acid ligase II
MRIASLAQLVRTHGRERARQAALTYGERRIGFATLDERASRVAGGLAAAGVGAQDRVALLDKKQGGTRRQKCPRSVDWVEALPRNPSGKILKRELRAPYWAGRERMVN